MESREIEPAALYRAAEAYGTRHRRGLVPLRKSAFYELVAAGKLPLLKIGDGRASFVRGSDLLALFKEAA